MTDTETQIEVHAVEDIEEPPEHPPVSGAALVAAGAALVVSTLTLGYVLYRANTQVTAEVNE